MSNAGETFTSNEEDALGLPLAPAAAAAAAEEATFRWKDGGDDCLQDDDDEDDDDDDDEDEDEDCGGGGKEYGCGGRNWLWWCGRGAAQRDFIHSFMVVKHGSTPLMLVTLEGGNLALSLQRRNENVA